MKKIFIVSILSFIPILFFAQKAGFIGVASTMNSIKDLDEKRAAEWFVKDFGGDYISVKNLDKTDLRKYKVLWIHVDRWDGICDVYNEIKSKKNIIRNYYADGGNLLLTTHAAMLLSEMGRINETPDVTSAEKGAYNYDIWSINPIYGIRCPGDNPIIDRARDPLYKGLQIEMITDETGYKFITYPLISNGWKEDHNCFWSMTVSDHPIRNESKSKIIYWEKKYNAQAVGTWGQIREYFGAAIARFLPTDSFKGKCISISLGAYEWNVNGDKTNPYHANIKRLTSNALNELME